MRRHTTLSLACVLATWLMGLNYARAVDDQVVILRVGDITPSMQEAVARMQGELAAAGFTNLLLDAQTTTNVTDEIDAINRVVKPAATFALQAQSGVAEVWFSDRRTGQHVSQLIDLAHEPPSRVPLVLAVRAAEFLRGHLSAAPPHRPPERAVRLAPLASPTPAKWSLGLGGLLLAEGGVKAASVSPSARVGFLIWPSLSLDVLLAGGGSEAKVKGNQGDARLTRQLLLIGGRFHHRLLSATLDLFAGLAAAAHHLSGKGNAEPGFAPAKDSAWTAGIIGEIGCRWTIKTRLWTELSMAMGRVLSKVRVRFDEETQQDFGSLSLQAGLSLGISL